MHQVKSGVGWRARWVLVGLAAAAALPAFAGIRGPTVTVNELTIDGHSYGGRGWFGWASWKVSSPTLRSPSGYLAYDASGKSPKVTFQGEKGPGTRWSFVEAARFEDHKPMGQQGGYYVSEEQTGYTMKVRAAEGPFEGWYLGRVDSELVLVKDRRQAATLRMLEKTVQIKGR